MAESIALNCDCMEYMKMLPDKAFDLAVVDPPYGGVTKGGYMVNNQSRNRLARNKDYHVALWSQCAPEQAYFDELFRVSKNQVIWGANYFQTKILRDSQGWIVWDKENGATKFADCELAWTSFDRATRIFRFRWQGMLQGDMANKEDRIHPTQKPVALYRWIFTNYAKPGDRILDTHLGSGSSRISAYDAGLDFVGCEIDETYFRQQEERFAAHVAQENLFLKG
ncbi:MAG: site-specific DNA-methyltransferase [Oscillospiraceae bacterium]|nr:site-specific DNA-methyltransferase [Oscillospiraceae bacterium]